MDETGREWDEFEHQFFDESTAEGNPGVGGCGAICYDDMGTLSYSESAQLGFVTSNVAEYYGLIIGLRCILQDYPVLMFDLTISCVSELVIKQMSGDYEVRSSNLIPLYHVVTGLVDRIKGRVRFVHIPREENKGADSLAQKSCTSFAIPG